MDITEITKDLINAYQTVPSQYIEDNGFTQKSHNKPLSQGCQACKRAGWLCLVMGTKCNLACDWCTQVRSDDSATSEMVWGIGGNFPSNKELTIDLVEEYLTSCDIIKGISYTGGEPLLKLDIILEWTKRINQKFPRIYQWIYTNGLILTESIAKELTSAGMDEIRVDLAATNYNMKIIDKLRFCRKYFDHVSVEVPYLEWQEKLLMDSIPLLDEIGVNYLNIHDLVIGTSNIDIVPKYKLDMDNMFFDKRFPNLAYRYLPTTYGACKIVKFVQNNSFNIQVNNCNLVNYINQGMGFAYQRLTISEQERWMNYEDYRQERLTKYEDLTQLLGKIRSL